MNGSFISEMKTVPRREHPLLLPCDMRTRLKTIRILLAAIVISVASISTVFAQAEAEYQLDIPQQDLGAALAALAKQASFQLVYPTQLTDGKVSHPINGSMTIESALDKMLSPVGLRYEFLDTQTVMVSAASSQGTGVL